MLVYFQLYQSRKTTLKYRPQKNKRFFVILMKCFICNTFEGDLIEISHFKSAKCFSIQKTKNNVRCLGYFQVLRALSTHIKLFRGSKLKYSRNATHSFAHGLPVLLTYFASPTVAFTLLIRL